MSEYTVRVKAWVEMDVEAASLEEAEDLIYKKIEDGYLDFDILGYVPTWSEVISVEANDI